jgi:hypothetical protein
MEAVGGCERLQLGPRLAGFGNAAGQRLGLDVVGPQDERPEPLAIVAYGDF